MTIASKFNYSTRIIQQSIELLTYKRSPNNDLTNGLANTYSQMAWNTYLIDPLYQGNQLIDGEMFQILLIHLDCKQKY